MQISFTPEFAARLRAESGEQSERVHNPHGGANTYELERMLDQGGGLILGPTHHVQLDTPLENFWAMVDTIKNPQA